MPTLDLPSLSRPHHAPPFRRLPLTLPSPCVDRPRAREDDETELRAELTRWSRRVDDAGAEVLVQFRRSGPSMFAIVRATGLRPAGMKFLLPGYVHAGTRCVVALAAVDGEVVLMPSSVLGCRHVAAQCHEVEVCFDLQIEASDFAHAQP